VSVDDEQLVARAQAGDRVAFEELVRRHAERLHAVVARLVADRHEAEEVTQEAFLRAWRGIAAFKGEARFFTWLYGSTSAASSSGRCASASRSCSGASRSSRRSPC
jgi:DNA-directed RNA polymerase specialized sigma24 family protein